METQPVVVQLNEGTSFNDLKMLLSKSVDEGAEQVLGEDPTDYIARALLKAAKMVGMEDVMYCQDLKRIFSLTEEPLSTRAMLLILQVGLSTRILLNPVPAYYVFYGESAVAHLQRIGESLEAEE
ncbi:MAG: hypothetical protein PHS44_07375 [Candidatus Dojkabacteria bacterium]|jgi:hypothetical protein|nr:hypothetical protein [Candidatus Dojkabacteria bacterium]